MARRSSRIYVFNDVVFVQADVAPLWVRSHVSIVKVPCTVCGAAQFELCRSTSTRNRGEHVTYTHYQRRAEAKGKEIPKSSAVMLVPGPRAVGPR